MAVMAICSGRSSMGCGAGIVALTLAPWASCWEGLARRPSTATKPSSIRRRTWLRASSRQRRARKTSRRSPERSGTVSSFFMCGGLRRWCEEGVAQKENGDADDEGGVGEVESRPKGEVYEVRDAAQAQPVQKVAHGSAQHHTHGDGDDQVVERWVAVVEIDRHQTDEGGEDEEAGLVLEDAEGGAGVGDMMQAHGPVGAGPDGASVQEVPHQFLRDLVEGEHR